MSAIPTAVPTPPRFFDSTDGVRVAVRELGPTTGRPLVFVHGFMGGALTWKTVCRSSLASEFRLVLVDLRGHGDSGKPSDPAAYGDSRRWADDLSAVMNGLSLQNAVLVAHSYGGSVAMDYFRHAGTARMGGVFFVAAAVEPPGCHPHGYWPEAAALLHPIVGAALPERIDAVRAFVRSLTADAMAPETFERFLAQAIAFEPAMLLGAFSREPESNDDVLRQLTCPVAFVMGDKENVVTPAMADFVKSSVPHVHSLIYPQVGHLPQLEVADTFIEDLALFARR